MRSGLSIVTEVKEKKKLDRQDVFVVPIKKYQAEEVRRIRKSLGMSQKVFGGYLGMSQKAVESWETGINHPSGPASRLLAMMEMNRNLTKEYPFVKISENE